MNKINSLLFLLGLLTSLQSAANSPLWMRYPVISPDGTTIVFAYKGDLYKVAASGGNATPLTVHEANDFMPVFSPDGSTIAFASDRNGNFDVYTIPVNGGTAQRLTFHSSNDFPQCFSPDGSSILFSATRQDHVNFTQFPYGALGELYTVSTKGGRQKQFLSIAAEDVKWNKAGTKMLFHDKKGYEDPWRKHHTSSVARDLFVYDKSANSFTKLTDFKGEDRNAVWSSDEQTIYYLSEQDGTFNVWSMPTNAGGKAQQITDFKKNPVRFLSISNSTLCFGYNGEIYTQTIGGSPKKVAITITTDERFSQEKTEVLTSGASEMSISPSGKEIAFIVHGEVYVTSMEGGITKRITNTPEQERNVSFSPDGKKILYAAERNEIWGIYETSLVRKEEVHFFNSTTLTEATLVKSTKESFQPSYSPDGKEVAFLEDRTGISIYNLAAKKVRNVLPANRNYSYSDGDQSFTWSPDSKHLLVHFLQDGNWREQIGLLSVDGKNELLDLTQSGFSGGGAKFAVKGNVVTYFSSRNGMKNVASHGSQSDVYAIFLTQKALDRHKMKKTEYTLLKELEEKAAKDSKDTSKTIQPIVIEKEGLYERKVRLTLHSSDLNDAVLTHDGEKLYYFAAFEDGIDLWVTNFKDNETKLFLKLNAGGIGSLTLDSDGKNLFAVIDGSLTKIKLEGAEKKVIAFNAEMIQNSAAERAYLFEHMWRQVVKKFYVTDLQGTDWNYYKTNYAQFLPHINNNRDFAEMSSELLGELNASHTGCRYNPRHKNPDETAHLGAFFDESYTGKGLKIAEVIAKGPMVKEGLNIKAGMIIEQIDGNEIDAATDYFKFLNRKAGKNTLITVVDEAGVKSELTIVPISYGQMNPLLYQRWIKRMQKMTDELSGGKLGYMHVQGMDDGSYREFYDQVMGKYVNKQALIVDTRFNGGGWLHDDLATFLSGKQYINFVPREQKIGIEPANKWNKPSVVLMSEGNYSDAHMFPVVYKTLGIGKLVGMPVPGTGTAVWWETLQDPTLVFGIPQVGVMSMDGKYYENNQLEPDVMVVNDYPTLIKGEDAQLKKAVELLLK